MVRCGAIKELQLLNPNKFANIFLGIGGFHLEKIIISCCGKYLEESGIDTGLVENEIYGLAVVKSVMDGGHYVCGKRGISLISEALEHLQLSAFVESVDGESIRSLLSKLVNSRIYSRQLI